MDAASTEVISMDMFVPTRSSLIQIVYMHVCAYKEQLDSDSLYTCLCLQGAV